MSKMTQLKQLGVFGRDGITDAGLVHLTKLTHLKWLTLVLDVESTTPEGFERLQLALPDCEISTIITGADVDIVTTTPVESTLLTQPT